ncbi:MAG: HAMP domain-containing histidine kinase, partial [Candidatus Dormibacteraeota bacterium]|nr:HAMP domain-containing histidine kinase [Candidatus Dormibacteraeota bacterium]
GATAVVGVLLLALCAGVDLLVAHNLRASIQTNVTDTVARLAAESSQRRLEEPDLDEPVASWRISAAGSVIDTSPGAPALPAALTNAGEPQDASIGGTNFLVAGAHASAGRVVAAESLASVDRAVGTIVVAELAIVPVLLVAVFGGALLVGRRAAAPLQRARQRQLDFIADASHELRTPLSVIEAEASLALTSPRDSAAPSAALGRVLAESHVMRRMIDDMLWLARFDSSPLPPLNETVDLGTTVEVAAERFRSVAARRGVALEIHPAEALVQAPPEWIDRLVGVLVDNACKYAPPDGVVRISAGNSTGRSQLIVEDSGPGIPMAARSRVFDRFHRETRDRDGTGLGLAIGDAIVHATRGQWEIGESSLGGASMTIVWPAAAR